jgi:hypothetical protein
MLERAEELYEWASKQVTRDDLMYTRDADCGVYDPSRGVAYHFRSDGLPFAPYVSPLYCDG